MSHKEQNFARRMRDLGYRITPQRQLILDSLCDLGDHATIAEIYEVVHAQSPAIDLATVYRSINLFCKLQLVVSAEINNATVYEIAEETPHHHLVCRLCGNVAALPDYYFQPIAEQIKDSHQFKAEFNHLTISGICKSCQ